MNFALFACASCVALVTFACAPASNAPELVAAPAQLEAAAPAAPETSAPAPSVPHAPIAAATQDPSAPDEHVTPAPVPNWTVNGSDPASGRMVLRCENAFPPEDHSGKCMCQGYELALCASGTRQLMIDRKQCGFICKQTPTSAKDVALRCPDGATPQASAQGCACSGRKPLDPCAGGIASTKVTAGECVVTCKAAQ